MKFSLLQADFNRQRYNQILIQYQSQNTIMEDKHPDLNINVSTYDLCVRAFRTSRKLLKLNIKLHDEVEDAKRASKTGDIFLFNHFARFETFIPQYLLHEATGAYCRSVASAEFFDSDDRFSQFLYSIGVVPNDLPNLFPFLAKEILHGRKLIIFPEGGMVKDKQVIDQQGQYNVFSRTANSRRKHHRGAAVIAMTLDAFKAALLHDFTKGNFQQVDRWAEQLEFNSSEELMVKALKPTVIVPSNITFYPIRVSDNILHQAVKLFNKGINKRFAEELIIEGNLLFKDTDMDIHFAKPIVAGDYWRWWEKMMLPNVVHQFDSLSELFKLEPDKGHLGGKLHSLGMKAKSNKVRDDYMHSMYGAVTINLSHIASYLILALFKQGLRRLNYARFHKILYFSIKKIQATDYSLHRSLHNPEEYGAIINQGTSRLDQFLKTAKSLALVHLDKGCYVLDKKLIEDFEIDEIRTENLIAVYANEISPLLKVTRMIESSIKHVDEINAKQFAQFRFDDEKVATQWDKKKYKKPKYDDINQQQTATADPNWFFLKAAKEPASAVLLIHGFLAGPTEMRSLGDRLHKQGHHVLGVRLKGHGTSPWDLQDRNWQEWLDSVVRGFDIIKVFSQSIHIIGFSTGGLLALMQASLHPHKKIKSVISISAPVEFKNKNLKFVPLLHHANRLARLIKSDGIMPFQPNTTEHPDVNYQHIPVRALYQLQQLIGQLMSNPLKISAKVHLLQSKSDPVVEPSSVESLYKHIEAKNKSITMINADRHGIVYQNIDDVQEKIADLIKM
ncbi:MAG: esterase/lipase [Gammaproteobacteria bacterium]